MPTNNQKQLRIEINLFILQVQMFYDRHSRSDINKKSASINEARKFISEINRCHPIEIPFRIIALRRLLISLLPYTSYPEHKQLSTKLDEIVSDCHLHIVLVKSLY